MDEVITLLSIVPIVVGTVLVVRVEPQAIISGGSH